MDECLQGTHSCGDFAVCSNTKGSYDCSRKTGYTSDGQNCTRLGKNPLIASKVGSRSFNDIDLDIPSYCESKYEDADSKIDSNDLDDDDSRTTTLMIIIVMAIL